AAPQTNHKEFASYIILCQSYFLEISVVSWSILYRRASLTLLLSTMLSGPLQLGHLKNNSTAESNLTRGQSWLPRQRYTNQLFFSSFTRMPVIRAFPNIS